MNAQEFAALKERAKEAWSKMERWRLAYRSHYSSLNNRAQWLKWGTVICGVLTGASSLTFFLGEDPTKFFTGVGGFLTGTLATLDKVFQWEPKANEAWRNAKLLEDLQSDLYQYLWTVSASKPIETPEQFLATTNNKISNYTAMECRNPDHFRDKAIAAANQLFDNMQLVDQPDQDDTDDDDILPEDIEGIEGMQPAIGGGEI